MTPDEVRRRLDLAPLGNDGERVIVGVLIGLSDDAERMRQAQVWADEEIAALKAERRTGGPMADRSKRDRDVHVCNVRGTNKWWFVIYRGVVIAETFFKKQGDAVRLGREAAKLKKCELVIHGRDGKIRRKVSYGNDPKKSKG